MNAKWLKPLISLRVILSVCLICISSYYFVDKHVAEYCHALNISHITSVINHIMLLGEGSLYVVLFFCLALWLQYRLKNDLWARRCWFLFGSMSITMASCLILKVLLGRARPILWFSDNLYGFYGWHLHSSFWSLPSGHTATFTSLFLSLAAIFPRYLYLFCSIIFVLIATRVLCCNHYVSDVIATAYLTTVVVSALIYFLHKKGIKYA